MLTNCILDATSSVSSGLEKMGMCVYEVCDCSADIEKRARKGGETCTSVHDYEKEEGCEQRKANELGG